jgi:hypothetical protein
MHLREVQDDRVTRIGGADWILSGRLAEEPARAAFKMHETSCIRNSPTRNLPLSSICGE